MSLLDASQILQSLFNDQTKKIEIDSNILSSVLPDGASKELKQDTANTSLHSIDLKLNTLGQKNSVGSLSIVLASDQSPISVTGIFYPAIQPISIASTISVTGPLTDTQLRATSVPVSGSLSINNFPASQAVTGTFFQATQPISVLSLPLPSGASTETTLLTLNNKITLVNTNSVIISSSVLPTGASTDTSLSIINANITNGNQKSSVAGDVASGAVDSGFPVKIGAVYNTSLSALTSGKRNNLQLNKFGELSIRQRNNYSHIIGAQTKLVKTGPAILNKIIMGTVNGTSQITVYDGVDATGYVISIISCVANSTTTTIHFDVEISTGITIVTAGAANMDITVLYQ